MEKRNISIAKANGYTYEKVMKAKKYIEEIGNNKRNFPFDKLVGYYNELLGTHDSTSGCRCQSPKYYNGIQNYYKYGKLTLINSGKATEEDFIIKEEKPVIENEEKRINLGTEEIVSVNDSSLETQNEASESVSEEVVEDTKEDENEEPTAKKKGRPRGSKQVAS